MHDNGRIINIGPAASVIKGIAYLGVDPDGSDFPQEFEFEFDMFEEAGFTE